MLDINIVIKYEYYYDIIIFLNADTIARYYVPMCLASSLSVVHANAIPPSLQSHVPPSSSSHSSSDTHHHRRVVASPWPSSSAACRLHVGFLRGPKLVLTWSQDGFTWSQNGSYLVPEMVLPWFWHCVRKNGSYLGLEWFLLVLTICFWFLLGSGMVLTGFDNLFLVLTRPQNGSYWA